jgi:hypothetical protein
MTVEGLVTHDPHPRLVCSWVIILVIDDFSPLRISLVEVMDQSSYSATPTPQDVHGTSHFWSLLPVAFGEDNNLISMEDNKKLFTQGYWRNHQDPQIWTIMEPAIHSFQFLMLTGDIFRNHMVMHKYANTAFETAFESISLDPFEVTSPMITTVSSVCNIKSTIFWYLNRSSRPSPASTADSRMQLRYAFNPFMASMD